MQINKIPFSQFKAVMRNALSLSKKSALKIIIFDLSFVALIGICYGVVALLFAILSPILPKWLIIILGIISLIAAVYLSATLFARVFYSKINFIWRIRNHETPRIKDLWRGLSPPMSLARINVYFISYCMLLLVIAVLCAIFAPNVFKFSKIIFSLVFYVIVTISEFAVIAIILNEITPKQALIDASKIVKTNIALTLIMPIAISYVVSILFLLCFLLLPSKAVIVISGILYFSFFMYWQVVLLNYGLSIYQMSVETVARKYSPQPSEIKIPNLTNERKTSTHKKWLLILLVVLLFVLLLIKLTPLIKNKLFPAPTIKTVVKDNIDPELNSYTNVIALSLNGKPITTSSAKDYNYYDKFNNGINGSSGWVDSNAGILVLLSGESVEVIGSSGLLKGDELLQNAYQSLYELNGNYNDTINQSSPLFSKLRLWVGGNGLKGSGELKTLAELHIKSIKTVPDDLQTEKFANGNIQVARSNFVYDNGNVSPSVALKLLYDPKVRVFSDTIKTESVATLPEIIGSGAVRDLREAMVLSPALKNAVSTYMYTTGIDYDQQASFILQLWAETSSMETLGATLSTGHFPSNGKRGTNLSESEIMIFSVLEKFSGSYGIYQGFLDPQANSPDGRFRFKGIAPNGIEIDDKGLNSAYYNLKRLLKVALDEQKGGKRHTFPVSILGTVQKPVFDNAVQKKANLNTTRASTNNITSSSKTSSESADIFTLIKQNLDADAIKILFELNPHDKQELAKYIESNVTSMKPPYIFWLSEQKYQNNHLDQAAFYYLFARLRLVEDIERCNDASAGEGVFMLIGKLAPNAMVYTTQTISSKKRYFIGKHVVRLDSKHPNQLSPQWICVHGIKAFSSNGVQIASKSNWGAIYTEQRNNFIKILKKSESNTIRKQK